MKRHRKNCSVCLVGVILVCWMPNSVCAQTSDYRGVNLRLDEIGFSLWFDEDSLPDSATNPPNLTTLSIEAYRNYFSGNRPEQLTSWFDVFNSHKLFHMAPYGFATLDFGPVISPEVDINQLASELCVTGTFLGGGFVGDVYLNGVLTTGCVYSHSPGITDPTIPQLPHTDDSVERPETTDSVYEFISYDPASGTLSVTASYQLMSILDITSNQGLFTTQRPDLLSGSLDQFTEYKLTYERGFGIGTTEFVGVLPANLPEALVRRDLCVTGARIVSGPLGIRWDNDPLKPILGCLYQRADSENIVSLAYDENGNIFGESLGTAIEWLSLQPLYAPSDLNQSRLSLVADSSNGISEFFLQNRSDLFRFGSDTLCFAGAMVNGKTIDSVFINGRIPLLACSAEIDSPDVPEPSVSLIGLALCCFIVARNTNASKIHLPERP
ncbi:MAG: hypothetical protein KDA87_03430 [Planctomycetales bacterium]|nr:hypothetical protein [Planctomycetales bacterium]